MAGLRLRGRLARGEKAAEGTTVQPASCDHTVPGRRPSVAPTHDLAAEPPAHHQRDQTLPGGATAGSVQFGRVVVGEPHLDPGRRIASVAHTQAVTVSHIADHAGETLADPVRETPLTGIGPGRRGDEQGGDGQERAGEDGGGERDAEASRRTGGAAPERDGHAPETDTDRAPAQARPRRR